MQGRWFAGAARMQRKRCIGFFFLVLAAVASVRSEDTAKMKLARIKDVASVEGVRDNQLVGYGIVVGLHGTGDSSQTVFPLQTLQSALERLGVSLQGNAMPSM